MLSSQPPDRLIGDKAYDIDGLADELKQEGVELTALHRTSRGPEDNTQDGLPFGASSAAGRSHLPSQADFGLPFLILSQLMVGTWLRFFL